MLYQALDLALWPARPLSSLLLAGSRLVKDERNPWRATVPHRLFGAACELPYRALRDYGKQRFGVRFDADTGPQMLEEQVVASFPFADLVRFPVEDGRDRPKVLIVAALSGHHATLLRDTVRGFARDFDPYITDWRNARDVPLADGPFGLDEYVEHIMRSMRELGPGTHMVATCQAAPAALAASALLAAREPGIAPVSLTLMAGPVDIRVNKNFVGKVAERIPLKLLHAINIWKVPAGYPGAGRRVYPGMSQLTAFMLMNISPHVRKYGGFVKDLVAGNDNGAAAFREFYDEYFSVLDMTEEFYLDTLSRIFYEHQVARGVLTYRGERVPFDAIEHMPLLTVEGERDNMCALGQTHAAHAVCANIPDSKRGHHVQPGVGHYGVFSGSRFQQEIYPVVRDFIRRAITPA